MKKNIVFYAFLMMPFICSSQKFIQSYQDHVNTVSQNNINTYLEQFEKLGVKTTGSANNAATLVWLKNIYFSLGYSENQIEEDSFEYEDSGKIITSKNLIITKKGTLYPDTYVIICGHFDSKNGPGVNDNGSGTSVILETARILEDIPTEYSVKFIHFSGEEQMGKGSAHYVNSVVYQNNIRKMDVKLVLNLDQVGGKKGNRNTRIFCEKDQAGTPENNRLSASFTRQLMTCVELYSPLKAWSAPAYNSDYTPFEKKGEVITGLYEYIESGNEHTENDTFVNIDPIYIFNVCKATVGAVQHFTAVKNNL